MSRSLRPALALLIVLGLSVLGGHGGPSTAAAEARPRPLVVLDPGHGGDEPGAEANGIVERDSNLDMAFRVRALLIAAGVDVLLTRTTSQRADSFTANEASGFSATFDDLQARIAFADAARADAFLSLHSNFMSDPAARGVDAWFNSARPFADESELLARLVRSHLSDELVTSGYEPPTGAARDDTELTDEEGNTSPLFVLGPPRAITRQEMLGRGGDPDLVGFTESAEAIETAATTMPGALLELFYVSNPDDAALLQDDAARAAMARGIVQGLLEYLRATGALPAAAATTVTRG